MSEYKSGPNVSYDSEDLYYLNHTDGLRVSPGGVIHRADCRTRAKEQRPVVLPWPKYDVHGDRPCRVCHPDVEGK